MNDGANATNLVGRFKHSKNKRFVGARKFVRVDSYDDDDDHQTSVCLQAESFSSVDKPYRPTPKEFASHFFHCKNCFLDAK